MCNVGKVGSEESFSVKGKQLRGGNVTPLLRCEDTKPFCNFIDPHCNFPSVLRVEKTLNGWQKPARLLIRNTFLDSSLTLQRFNFERKWHVVFFFYTCAKTNKTVFILGFVFTSLYYRGFKQCSGLNLCTTQKICKSFAQSAFNCSVIRAFCDNCSAIRKRCALYLLYDYLLIVLLCETMTLRNINWSDAGVHCTLCPGECLTRNDCSITSQAFGF